MMNNEQFWAIIDKARDKAGGVVRDIGTYRKKGTTFCDILECELASLEDADIIKWQQIYDEYYYPQAPEWDMDKLWASAHLINGFCSNKGFGYFRNWLISSGKFAYLKAMYEPDDLADIEINGYAVSKGLSDVAANAFNAKRGLRDSYALFKTIMQLCAPMTDEEKLSITSEIKYSPSKSLVPDEGHELKKWFPKLSKKYKRGWKKAYISEYDARYDWSNLYICCHVDL